MKHGTKIEWTHFPGYKGETWNPVTGCTKVSLGCENCYAERVSKRFGLPWGESVTHKGRLEQPLHWRKPRAVFVCSMSDLFHEKVPDSFIDQVFATIAASAQHIFVVLTKRHERAQKYMSKAYGSSPLQNVIFGVSVENQEAADARIPFLLKTPAVYRLVSCEPLLGPVRLNKCLPAIVGHRRYHWDAEVDWVVCGGETGSGARYMKPKWARNIRDQCKAAMVPFFMKQMTKKAPIPADLLVRQFPEVKNE